MVKVVSILTQQIIVVFVNVLMKYLFGNGYIGNLVKDFYGGGVMIFKFLVNGTVRAKSVEDASEKLKSEFGEEFFQKHISFGSSEEDNEQEVDIK